MPHIVRITRIIVKVRKMKLSEIKDNACIKVMRHGEFESLKAFTHNMNKQLGFI